MQATFALLAAAVALVSGQAVTQIPDGQIQAPTSTSVSKVVGSSTILLPTTSQTTIVLPSTVVVPSTSHKAVTSSVTLPVTLTTSGAVLTQITDGQIQAPQLTTRVITSSIVSVFTSSVPIYLNSTYTTSYSVTSPVVLTNTQVIPFTSTITHSAVSSSTPVVPVTPVTPPPSVPATTFATSSVVVGSSCYRAISQISDGQVQAATYTTCVPVTSPVRATASSTSPVVVSYTGAAAPTKAASALGALVLGAAALVLA